MSKMNRRSFLRGTAMTAVGVVAASCAQPTAQVIEKEVPVEVIVKETVVVEKEVAVEKVVKETVVVETEKEVEVTKIVEKEVEKVEKEVAKTEKAVEKVAKEVKKTEAKACISNVCRSNCQ